MPKSDRHARHTPSGVPERAVPAIRPPRRRPAEAGFTLVELLVVLAIIGLLTTVVVINVLPMQGRAQVQKAKADIAIIEQGLEFHRLGTGRYPTGEEGLGILTTQTVAGAPLKSLPDDPWGNPYQYRSPGEGNRPYDLWSWGADGEEGGEGEAADIRAGA
jgi:general secretion pathway protein G